MSHGAVYATQSAHVINDSNYSSAYEYLYYSTQMDIPSHHSIQVPQSEGITIIIVSLKHIVFLLLYL